MLMKEMINTMNYFGMMEMKIIKRSRIDGQINRTKGLLRN